MLFLKSIVKEMLESLKIASICRKGTKSTDIKLMKKDTIPVGRNDLIVGSCLNVTLSLSLRS